MSELTDRVGGDTIPSAFHNQVKERTIMRYASAVARDASIPVPVEGSLAYLNDVNIVTLYDGFDWVNLPDLGGHQTASVTTTLTAAQDVYETIDVFGLPSTGTWNYVVSWWSDSAVLNDINFTAQVQFTNIIVRSVQWRHHGSLASSWRTPVTMAFQVAGNLGDIMFLEVRRDDVQGTQVLQGVRFVGTRVTSS